MRMTRGPAPFTPQLNEVVATEVQPLDSPRFIIATYGGPEPTTKWGLVPGLGSGELLDAIEKALPLLVDDPSVYLVIRRDLPRPRAAWEEPSLEQKIKGALGGRA